MFFENESYFRYVDLLRNAGVEVPVVPGIMPVTGFAQLDKFEHQFGVILPADLRDRVSAHEGDENAVAAVGVEWTTEQCQSLLEAGAPGIHFYTLNRSSSTVNVCLEMGLKGKSRPVYAVDAKD